MNNPSSVEHILKQISPSAVSEFLLRHGYIRDGGKPGIVDIYVNNSGNLVLLPLVMEAEDYARRLIDIAQLFMNESRTLDDVIGRIVLPDSDILRYRIASPETTWGHLRLQSFQMITHAIFDLLQYTAAGVSSGKADYRKISASARSFSRQCRFGQTEYGSFILKVFCPVNPAGIQDQVGLSFGRSTTRSVIENLEYLSSERSEDPSEPLPPTLNRNVASAVERLKPQAELGSVAEINIQYSAGRVSNDQLFSSPLQDETSSNLELSPFIYSRAQSVRDRLKKADELTPELLRGYIVNFHKDRPIRDTDQSHEVTLEVKYGASWRQLRIRLMPRQYREAMVWQNQDRQVDVDGIIDKRGRVWSVYRLNDFRLSDPTSSRSSLFSDD